ncbi:MAG: hypothetical protein CMD16_05230 [Flavobacteriales bacterium]|nr:hypothetical protein [Flavobacteriales bacterium]|tara:strand:- start:23435 stop:23854 length:420 start_codon:yes stop_codon:yes gene_type:complete
MNNPNNTNSITQDSNEINAIKKILTEQQNCWNKGDIEGFMQGYWNSEELIFTSLSHKPAYGWENTLERYKSSYPTKESMGLLKFQILELQLNSEKTAALKGKWELIRENDHPYGMFWLDLKKFEENWLIIKDSTISLIN